MWALHPTARAGVETGREAGHCERSELVRVEDEARRGPSTDERLEGPDQQLDLLDGRFSVLRHEPFRRLEHRRSGGVRGVVGSEITRERVERLDLGDDVEAA